MIIIILLISISLIIALGFLFFFLWALKSGQYDDTDTPSVRMLFNAKVREEKQDNKTSDQV
jgi:cbb3-type cytochrome oxidase maturation protein